MNQAIIIHHELADISLIPKEAIDRVQLEALIRSTLDQYLESSHITAETIHHERQ